MVGKLVKENEVFRLEEERDVSALEDDEDQDEEDEEGMLWS